MMMMIIFTRLLIVCCAASPVRAFVGILPSSILTSRPTMVSTRFTTTKTTTSIRLSQETLLEAEKFLKKARKFREQAE
jgi:hypothetical protein